jgi:organic radical activating enzyme
LRWGGTIRWASITGGEPLEQPDFVERIARWLKERGLGVLLETNGVEAQAMRQVLPWVDRISMDLKLPSALQRSFWEEHRAFLEAVGDRGGAVKLVLEKETPDEEVREVVEWLARHGKGWPLILQPDSRTLFGADRAAAGALVRRAMELQRWASARLEDVRVIPQVHRLLRVP